ncbi:uncharacterized protein EAE98_005507 [Botrytis deweyae]|uniref:Jacalin-type lectin domain-containing protein n=1 Tax=Botrytis deweyae TaxID=2478750 RepID=A0ABQ7IMG8_9HELO|nr:uncharacterized protein EAE98_005507 [Botrytis deweyae]KAF7928451.1 hypothetical protein EAE98_005507 [Botrytis deweyae]
MAPTAWWHSIVGGPGGEPFQHVLVHDPVSKIEIWTSSAAFFHGAQSPLIGKAEGTLKFFTIAYGELVISIIAYTNGSSFAGVSKATDQGRSFMAGTIGLNSHRQDPRSGFIVGFIGRRSHQFDAFSLGMLDDLQSCLVEMNYLTMPKGGVSDVSVVRVTKDNEEGARDAGVNIGESVSTTSSVTTSKTWGESMGISVSVSGKVFGVGVDASTEYTYGEERSESSSYSITKATDISAAMQVPPGKKYLITALYYKGTFDVEFRPKYTFMTKTGFRAMFPEGAAQPVSGIASGNMIITTNDITDMSPSQISQLISPSTKIGDKSTSEAEFENVLTREVLDSNARNFAQEVGVSADDQ